MIMSSVSRSSKTVDVLDVDEIEGDGVTYKSLISSSFVIFFVFFLMVCKASSMVIAVNLRSVMRLILNTGLNLALNGGVHGLIFSVGRG